jgi:hypothetical protein
MNIRSAATIAILPLALGGCKASGRTAARELSTHSQAGAATVEAYCKQNLNKAKEFGVPYADRLYQNCLSTHK